MTTTISNFEENMKEYRLMYNFGAWITSARIYAETDREAIFDANSIDKKAGLRYALFCENRMVKDFN